MGRGNVATECGHPLSYRKESIMRIAVAGFMHEANTLCPLRTDRAAFVAQSLTFGRAMLDEWRDAHHEVGGFLTAIETPGDEPVPICMPWATPSAAVADAVLHFMLRHGLRPVQALAKPPLIVNIMAHDTSREPLRSFMEELSEAELRPGIDRISFLPGFAYADVPQMGPSVLVVADNDRVLAAREAARIADQVWNMRDRLTAKLP